MTDDDGQLLLKAYGITIAVVDAIPDQIPIAVALAAMAKASAVGALVNNGDDFAIAREQLRWQHRLAQRVLDVLEESRAKGAHDHD